MLSTGQELVTISPYLASYIRLSVTNPETQNISPLQKITVDYCTCGGQQFLIDWPETITMGHTNI